MTIHRCDVLIIGSGTAGLALALKLSSLGKVFVLAKDTVDGTNSAMAQGGISAVMSESDSFSSHIQDTLVAGAGLCKESVVDDYVHQAPERIKDLMNWGVNFDVRKNEDDNTTEIDLTREGGHSFRRILHFEDQTGLEIHRTLLARVRENPRITLLEKFYAIDLIVNKEVDPEDMSPVRCVGSYALDKETGEVHTFIAKNTSLATGGAGKVYLYTSNWSGATGDGIAMAYRVGARIANLEFMQFHPTCLYHRDSRNFLISEALRGEGGELIDQQGQPFMKKYHPLGSLAPRDIVARSIDKEMKKSGAPCVYLDMTKLEKDFLQQRFPHIFQRCLNYGIDMSEQPIPVVPAAHYLCGGVVTDKNGQTDIPGLWAVGETACTGLHGANRLASNSLLECLTTAHNCAQEILRADKQVELYGKDPKPWTHPAESNDDEMIVIHHMWDEIRRMMWNYMGILRSNKRLERAQHRLKNILNETKEYYSNMKIHSDILELRNIATVADLSVECALRRHESRGIHYNIDHLETAETPQDTILVRGLI
ncbi:MAG: L-aspartate oxidase [Bdellovibrio sp.]